MIKSFASKVFQLPMPGAVDSCSIIQGLDQMNEDMEPEDANQDETQKQNDRVVQLAKLCFMVGHVAVKEIVHLEAIESEWKRRKYLGIHAFNL